MVAMRGIGLDEAAARPGGLAKAWGRVRGLERMSLCDWPGRVCAVLFLGGCNLRCPTCHNAELAWRPERLPALFPHDVLRFLELRRAWYDGLTVTGGEPTLVPGLEDLLDDLGRLSLPVKLDTNGMRPEVVEELLRSGLVEQFAVDVKGPFELYPLLTGDCASEASARHNLGWIFDLARSHPRSFLFRTTLVPALSERDVEAVRRCLPPGFELRLQRYKAPSAPIGSTHAQSDPETRRASGDVVRGAHRPGHPQGPEGERHQGPHPGLAAGQEGRVQAH